MGSGAEPRSLWEGRPFAAAIICVVIALGVWIVLDSLLVMVVLPLIIALVVFPFRGKTP